MLPQNNIIDIRAVKVEDSIYEAVLKDYYLRHEEIHILRTQAHKMTHKIAENSAIVDLGSGSLDKIVTLLDTLEAQKKKCAALHGTFEDGLEWIKEDRATSGRPHCVLFLGSTIGSFSRENAANFIRKMAASTCTCPGDQGSVLLSIDSCKLPTKVLRAFSSDAVVPFTMAGFQHASTIIRDATGAAEGRLTDVFQVKGWYYLSEYDSVLGRHEASYTPRDRDIHHKYNHAERKELFSKAGVVAVDAWADSTCDLAFYQLKLADQ
ncbi:uncharacterized protein BO97DRAFT_422809 [Aspergillus homomorphus CBS 101889]|uniref:Histidine-specific methyltransferase SAM-dependent domain-containing protein n=1 Tax=Aspergillus homomorphus (strain CBS 101889) TaxID=1450537 RepID=A0A395I2I8_ASPHC|nr:hypothetical protein BO97DRAFT_422809 [Aspergillus homomorphus CBS 101889]RAL14392.1 hypothetical protein BO97DRAFT_422809 [Aspergillus homomorphus CBS 101889]